MSPPAHSDPWLRRPEASVRSRSDGGPKQGGFASKPAIFAALAVTIVLVAPTAWGVWTLLDPWACDRAGRDLVVAARAVDELPTQLVERSSAFNDCESGDSGWVTVTAEPGVDMSAARSALESSGWTPVDSVAGSGDLDPSYNYKADGETVTVTLDTRSAASGALTATVTVD